jgi:metallophosphoesterase (TIGR03767 family)
VSNVSRRSIVLSGAGGLALAAIGGATSARATDRALRATAARAFSTVGTTLEQTASATPMAGYRRLVAGPGFPVIVREDLASAAPRRDDRRIAAASVVQVTDLHIMDAQSPMRFEFLVDIDSLVFRPQEALGTHAAAQLVERINQLARGPFSDRRFDCVVSTGDNSDNSETIELDWFLAVMNGGTITPNTGSPTRWEGVQTVGDHRFYRPESGVLDRYQKAGFPQIESYFDRVVKPHASPGLRTPWYSVFGNHDDSINGLMPFDWNPLDEFYTGTTKFRGFTSDADSAALVDAFDNKYPAAVGAHAPIDTSWQVTPDERRAPFSPEDFIAAHLAPSALGAGPIGHGFYADSPNTYYSFRISPGVLGISLDSTNQGGFVYGSLGDAQFRWLDSTLAAAKDDYVILFSHHTTTSMNNSLPDPRNPDETRHLGAEVVDLVHRYPHVLAWVNGHTHTNHIVPHRGTTPELSFWEINTASHIEFPQQARIIDVCRNNDGTVSLFTTLIESAAPYSASYSDGSQAALASLYREFSFNDLSYSAAHEGAATDRNTELLLVDPLV